ncbi:unnamed protein product [Phytophthora lilii]|uniref:Unnamed protein product n=1 Tax=Phytophthora lilii TaxID=2077276 RepID=A0A9W6U8M4_9STRA|nr:unnamed protein product [Phytophthora lilii]
MFNGLTCGEEPILTLQPSASEISSHTCFGEIARFYSNTSTGLGIGGIIGNAVGSLVLGLLVTGIFVWWQRSKRTQCEVVESPVDHQCDDSKFNPSYVSEQTERGKMTDAHDPRGSSMPYRENSGVSGVWDDEAIVTYGSQEVKYLSTSSSAGTDMPIACDSRTDVCAVSEYLDGGDLRGLLDSFAQLQHPVGFDYDKVKIALHIGHALTYLHSLQPPVIHRNLRLKNVLLTYELDAKLTDFGISREQMDSTMTAGVGSALWMAPEVVMGHRYDEKSDIFSFGVVLSELDVHSLPYSHTDAQSKSRHKMPESLIIQQMVTGKLQVEFS